MNTNNIQKEVKKFPIEVFPLGLQEVLLTLQESKKLPLDFFAVSMLSVFSTVIGNRFKVEDLNDYQQIASLYIAIIGNSSIGKSPAINWCLRPLYQLESEFRESFKEAINDEINCEELLITDATIESIVKILGQNPKGLLLYKDELVGWLNAMTRYSNGSDVTYYLEIWQGNFTKINRIGRASNFVKTPFLGIFGGTQPKLLYKFAKGDNLHNGLLQRILFSFPDNQKKAKRSKKRLDNNLRSRYDEWVRRVYNIPFDDNSPKILKLSTEADTRWEAFYNENVAEINAFEDKNHPIISCLGKLEQYCLRFSLILEVTKQSQDTFPDIDEVSMESMEKAILLIGYFKSMLYKVFEQLENPLASYSKKDLAFLNALESDFDVSKGLEIADKAGLTKSDKTATLRRIFFRKMKQFIKDGVIEKVDKANYTKLI